MLWPREEAPFKLIAFVVRPHHRHKLFAAKLRGAVREEVLVVGLRILLQGLLAVRRRHRHLINIVLAEVELEPGDAEVDHTVQHAVPKHGGVRIEEVDALALALPPRRNSILIDEIATLGGGFEIRGWTFVAVASRLQVEAAGVDHLSGPNHRSHPQRPKVSDHLTKLGIANWVWLVGIVVSLPRAIEDEHTNWDVAVEKALDEGPRVFARGDVLRDPGVECPTWRVDRRRRRGVFRERF